MKADAEPEPPPHTHQGWNAQSWSLPEFFSLPQPLGVFEFSFQPPLFM